MDKKKQVSDSFIVMALLTFSGGLMDAYSYICRDRVFANAQTGNILLFGVNIASGNFGIALRYLFPVLSFAVGVAVSETVRHYFNNRKLVHWRQVTLLIEAAILLSVAFIPLNYNILANSLTSLACGTQVQSFRRVNGIGAATTMCIGNLRTTIESICEYRFSKNKNSAANAFIIFSLILIFVMGAVFGNLLVGICGTKAIMASSAIMVAAFFVILIKRSI